MNVTAEARAPRDWDGESYCCADGCHEAATHSIPFGLTGFGAVVVAVLAVVHPVGAVTRRHGQGRRADAGRRMTRRPTPAAALKRWSGHN